MLFAAFTAALTATAGLAYAASPAENQTAPAATVPERMGSDTMEQPGPDRPGAMTAPSGTLSNTPAQPAILPRLDIIGKEVVDVQGTKVGDVKRVVGDKVIVPVGGFMGLFAHDVALNWSQIRTQGTGHNERLQVALTADDLKEMPVFRN
jgi:hypothetical protein